MNDLRSVEVRLQVKQVSKDRPMHDVVDELIVSVVSNVNHTLVIDNKFLNFDLSDFEIIKINIVLIGEDKELMWKEVHSLINLLSFLNSITLFVEIL